MRTYRGVWHLAVAGLVAASVAAGGPSLGWVPLVGTTIALTVMGGIFGLTWVEDESRRRRAIIVSAMWFGFGGVLLLGLPSMIDVWALPVLGALGAGSPPVVEAGARAWRERRPLPPAEHLETLPDRELARRWRRTAQDLHDRARSVPAVLRLAEERSQILDEIERRDPERFAEWLVRAGWREPQDR